VIIFKINRNKNSSELNSVRFLIDEFSIIINIRWNITRKRKNS